jgi:hypothetical protein
MEYVYIKEEDRWEYHGKPDVKTPDEELIAAVVARVKAEREAVDRANERPRPRKTHKRARLNWHSVLTAIK